MKAQRVKWRWIISSIKEMFANSIKKFGIKYTNYIGNGDSKTFKAIVDLNPYGDNCPVTKNECVGHVKKRMGARLRNMKKEKKLGKNRLIDSLIKKLTEYYGLTIIKNIDSVKKMKQGMATLNHYCSTDTNSRHDFCPDTNDTWCE